MPPSWSMIILVVGSVMVRAGITFNLRKSFSVWGGLMWYVLLPFSSQICSIGFPSGEFAGQVHPNNVVLLHKVINNEATIRCCIGSMRKRSQACINSRGGHTAYWTATLTFPWKLWNSILTLAYFNLQHCYLPLLVRRVTWVFYCFTRLIKYLLCTLQV
jgi:hypothetical protein